MDLPNVTSADQSGAVPFLDIDNRYILVGALYNPQVLAGLTAAQIAGQLSNPSSPVARRPGKGDHCRHGGDAVVYLTLKGGGRRLPAVARPGMDGPPARHAHRRPDVAALLARLLTHSDGLRRQFEVTSGEEDLATVPL
jgi:hypothetical protein